MASDAIPVLTIESIPIARVIGGVSAIARHADAAQAEAAALAQLQASAAAAGADAVIGWRTAIVHEVTVESESPALSPQVMVRSTGGFVVHASGTAVAIASSITQGAERRGRRPRDTDRGTVDLRFITTPRLQCRRTSGTVSA